jgi:hypothetical protein
MEDLKLEHLNYESWLLWDDILSKENFKGYSKVTENDIQILIGWKVFDNRTEGGDWATRYARIFLSSVDYKALADCFNEKIEQYDK